MKYEAIIIAGPSGVGKTKIVKEMTSDTDIHKVKSKTTREPREDDYAGQYDYLTEDKFNKLEKKNTLLVNAKYRGEKYGIDKTDYKKVKDRGKVPLLVITPRSAKELMNKHGEIKYFSVFINSSDREIKKRLSKRSNDTGKQINKKQLKQDRSFQDEFLYTINNYHGKSSKTANTLVDLWEFRKRSGILSKRLIKEMIDVGLLLENSDPKRVSHASYDLSLGDEHYTKGKIIQLTETNPFLVIEPYNYAIVTSKEKTNFPRDITGRFDLTVGLFAQGIILSNGPQIDPGFRGKLFCLLFNTSDSKVAIKRDEKYATIEFHKLIEPTDQYQGDYQDKDRIQDYLPSNTMRGAISTLKKEIDTMKEEREKLQSVVFSRNITISLGFISFVLAIIAIVLTLLNLT